jgi:pectate lyase
LGSGHQLISASGGSPSSVSTGPETLTLSDAIAVLRRRIWLVASATVVAATAAAVYVIGDTPQYHATDVPRLGGLAVGAQPSVLAFPGAEGFGRFAKGGRGGTVFVVSHLNDGGPGSLRECVEASGPRTCVFRVGGTIVLNSRLDVANPYLTIAGQTAPGGGITLKAAEELSKTHLRVTTHDVVIRYLRSRPGTRVENGRALTVSNAKSGPAAVHNVIVDHVSLSWSADEIFLTWGETNNVTVQWSIMAESLPDTDGSVGVKGPNLGSEGGGWLSLHHNLLAHHVQRYPKMNPSGGPVDLVNNVMYNMGSWGHAIVQADAKVNFVSNYVKSGPNTTIETFVFERDIVDGGYYLSGNVIEPGHITSFAPNDHRSSTPFTTPPITTTPAPQALEDVLTKAGAIHGLSCDGTWFTRPDAVDVRIVQSVRDGTRGHDIPPDQTFRQLGFITSPPDVGGWPQLDPGTPCADSDNDGMPDVWEGANGLNPTVDDSAQDIDGDGYTNLEAYLNGKR